MAEEHINTAFGALGALDVIFRRCMEGFTFWQRVKGSSESIKNFQVLLDIQRSRLALWAQEWDIESNNQSKDRRFRMYEPAVMGHLRHIYSIFEEFGDLDTSGPVLTQTRTFVSMGVLPRINHSGASSSAYDGGSPSPRTAPSMDGIRWTLQEDKHKDGLALVTTLLDDLYSILPPSRNDPAGALVLSDSLTAQDPKELERISRVENNDPTHAALAWMKSIAHLSYGAYLGSNRLHTSHLVPIDREDGHGKFMARYQGELVLVEEKHCTAPWGQLEQLNVLKARIESIIVRLQNPAKPTDLRTLPCRGGVFGKGRATAVDGATWTYSIVYRAHYPRFTSLQKILSRKEKIRNTRFPLGKRFVLAQMLTRALMYLHLANWLHKAVRSENVVFFVDDDNSIQSNLPYLVGFEHSRADFAGEQTENIDEKPDHRFYRHPKAKAVPVADLRQPLGGPGCYSKVYDIYSMGVVLVEIGLFKTAESMIEKYHGSKDAPLEAIHEVLVKRAIPDLRFAVGDVYADAALACLNGSLDNSVDQSLHQAFYRNVVCQLECCKA